MGLPDLAAIPNFAASGMGRETQTEVSQLCPGGRKDPCPSQALCFSSWQKKRRVMVHFFLLLCSSSPAVEVQPSMGREQRGWGCSEPQQTPVPPAPKPSSSMPGTFNKTPLLNSKFWHCTVSATELLPWAGHRIIREHMMSSVPVVSEDDRRAEGHSLILFCFQAMSEQAGRCCRGANVKIQAGKTDRTWLRVWVCLGQSRNGVAML